MPSWDWTLCVRQGEANLARHGCVADGVRGEARSGDALDWCAQYQLQKSLTNKFSAYPTREWCTVLALAWIHRMEYFYSLNPAGADKHFVYTLVIVAGHREPDLLTVRLRHGDDRVQSRINGIRRMVPRLKAHR